MEERLKEFRNRKEETSLKITNSTIAHYQTTEQKRFKVLNKYSIQELENLISTSGKGYLLEFAKYLDKNGEGLLTQIHNFLKSRARSHTTDKKPKVERNEDENYSPKVTKITNEDHRKIDHMLGLTKRRLLI